MARIAEWGRIAVERLEGWREGQARQRRRLFDIRVERTKLRIKNLVEAELSDDLELLKKRLEKGRLDRAATVFGVNDARYQRLSKRLSVIRLPLAFSAIGGLLLIFPPSLVASALIYGFGVTLVLGSVALLSRNLGTLLWIVALCSGPVIGFYYAAPGQLAISRIPYSVDDLSVVDWWPTIVFYGSLFPVAFSVIATLISPVSGRIRSLAWKPDEARDTAAVALLLAASEIDDETVSLDPTATYSRRQIFYATEAMNRVLDSPVMMLEATPFLRSRIKESKRILLHISARLLAPSDESLRRNRELLIYTALVLILGLYDNLPAIEKDDSQSPKTESAPLRFIKVLPLAVLPGAIFYVLDRFGYGLTPGWRDGAIVGSVIVFWLLVVAAVRPQLLGVLERAREIVDVFRKGGSYVRRFPAALSITSHDYFGRWE